MSEDERKRGKGRERERGKEVGSGIPLRNLALDR